MSWKTSEDDKKNRMRQQDRQQNKGQTALNRTWARDNKTEERRHKRTEKDMTRQRWWRRHNRGQHGTGRD